MIWREVGVALQLTVNKHASLQAFLQGFLSPVNWINPKRVELENPTRMHVLWLLK